ncbi:hypothetical protein MSG28_001079 [Choristoneura fumiferana]|uniref:Uncharacterized protein n=1 Tax=Choristoneura fumiferana TaxID=7141 RepID=A0ACC0K3N4_CHOFU|nr:hypothetical protein MSG28_001079 [Choristoneura fumiferana]
MAVLRLLKGFLLTVTYKGIVVAVSPNVQQYLGYSELELLGFNISTITHEDDHNMLLDQLRPRSQTLGDHGELVIPDQPDGKLLAAKRLAAEKRQFFIRFKKNTQRSEPAQYVTCHVEGSLRKSDRASRNTQCCQIVHRARARNANPYSSGNDVVFIGVVRPTSETFKKESQLEQFRMEYRTRHSIDGQIIQCEKRIALVTGYMTDEVHGVNAMNFMHRDDVRWVIIALREMYDQHRLYGESCYRLMMKNGQFIYMRTRGCLEVESSTKAVTSFVCTNTVMNATEGQHLIRMMKKKFTLLVNNNEEPPQEPEVTDINDESLPVEDPRQLEKVILHLVTNLPSPQPEEREMSLSPDGTKPPVHLAIIPPRKERIVSAIEKIYSVIKTFKNPNIDKDVKRKKVTSQCVQEISEPVLNIDTTPKNSLSGTLPKITTIGTYRNQNMDDFGQIFQNVDTNPVSVEVVTEPIVFSDYMAQQPNKPAKFNFSKISADCEIVNLELPGTSAAGTAVKRPSEYQYEDGSYKKKMLPNDNESEEQVNGRTSSTLENFFNEAISTSQFCQINAALISLENTIDPSFPDLLISQDVQDILGELECEPEKPPDEQRSPN